VKICSEFFWTRFEIGNKAVIHEEK
jgi:hypothetical protein